MSKINFVVYRGRVGRTGGVNGPNVTGSKAAFQITNKIKENIFVLLRIKSISVVFSVEL